MSKSLCIIPAQKLTFQGGDPNRCQGELNTCPFETKQVPQFPAGCSRCRQIKNNLLALNWFLEHCTTDEINAMHDISHFDWKRDISGFEIKIPEFIQWFLANTDRNELLEFHRDIPDIFTSKNLLSDEQRNERLGRYILGMVRDTLLSELGTGQKHRKAMAYILNISFISQE